MERCGFCGKRATGFASIDGVRYCHEGEGRSCYERQQARAAGWSAEMDFKAAWMREDPDSYWSAMRAEIQ